MSPSKIDWGGRGFRLVDIVEAFGVDNTGATDAGPRLADAHAKLAASGQIPSYRPGTYKVATPVPLPNNQVTVVDAGVTFAAAIASTASPLDAVFIAQPTYGAFSTTLSADANPGDIVVHMTAAPTVNEQITISSQGHGYGQFAMIRTVKNVSGLGPFAVTLDEECPFPFRAVNALVQQTLSRPVGIYFYGNNCQFTGTGGGVSAARFIEIVGGDGCYFFDIQANESGGSLAPGALAFSFDVGSEDCAWIRGFGNLPSASLVWLAESGQRIRLEGCIGVGSGADGQGFLDCVDSQVVGAGGWANANFGAVLDTNGDAATIGIANAVCRRCSIEGAFTENGDGIGVGAAVDTTILASSACTGNDRATGNKSGIVLGAIGGSAAPTNVTIEPCALSGNANLALLVGAGCTGVSVQLGDVSGNAGGVVNSAVGLTLDFGGRLWSVPAAAGAQVFISAGQSLLKGLNAVVPTGYVGQLVFAAGDRIRVSDFHVSVPAAPAGAVTVLYCAAGVMQVDDTVVDGAGAGVNVTGILSAGGTTVRIGQNVAVDACATPLSIGGFASIGGMLTAGGGGGFQDFTFPDARITDRLKLHLTSVGGTPTPFYAPFYVATPGTKFQVFFAAGDTSTYEVIVGP